MSLKSQDIVIVLKLAVGGYKPYAPLALELGMSTDTVYKAIKRATDSDLLEEDDKGGYRGLRRSLCDFLIHGVRHAFPAKPGAVTIGMKVRDEHSHTAVLQV
jgi:hypothetical protein